MVLAERLAVSQKSERTDTERMVNDTERNVFSFLQDRLSVRIPGAQLQYESTVFSLERDDGSVSKTVPDIHIIKPNGTEIFLEITRSSKAKKNEKKKIMNNFPVRYVVWGRAELKSVQKTVRRRHPQFTLIHRDKRTLTRSMVQFSK